jgi:hypothetical protein
VVPVPAGLVVADVPLDDGPAVEEEAAPAVAEEEDDDEVSPATEVVVAACEGGASVAFCEPPSSSPEQAPAISTRAARTTRTGRTGRGYVPPTGHRPRRANTMLVRA